jgi:SOS-response transcriptional repressor LexA
VCDLDYYDVKPWLSEAQQKRNIGHMSFGDTLKKLRAQAGLSQRALAKMLGLSPAAIQRWEAGEVLPQAGRIREISSALGVTQTELLGLQSELSSVQKPRGRVPLISWVQAGQWSEAVDIYEPGVAEEWIPVRGGLGPNAFALSVSGDSMVSPFGSRSYPPGTVIVVDPAGEPTPGRRVVAKWVDGGDHHVTFKELQSDAGYLYLKPLNPQYPTIPVTPECEIVGVVVAAYHED